MVGIAVKAVIVRMAQPVTLEMDNAYAHLDILVTRLATLLLS